ncbi:MAG: hypothetical protein PHU46_15590 [Rhodocyclaceae bacterium]|nr:hypothetical protein [Rhodocyclaceae bacterium]
MGKIARPLDRDAVAAADQELYARHKNDPRPNALYDAEGRRLPLSPNDPSQAAARQEWCDLYLAAAEKNRQQVSQDSNEPPSPPPPPPPPPPDPERAADDPVQPCPNKHWIEVGLKASPDQQKRPDWWPPANDAPYAGESYTASGACGNRSGKLGGGRLRFDHIPAGSCDLKFQDFYREIERHFEEE